MPKHVVEYGIMYTQGQERASRHSNPELENNIKKYKLKIKKGMGETPKVNYNDKHHT